MEQSFDETMDVTIMTELKAEKENLTKIMTSLD